MPRNYFGSDPYESGQQAFGNGYDRTQALGERVTTNQAGRQLAQGDRRGAASTFAAGGMIAPARQMEGDQQALDDRASGQAMEERKAEAQQAKQRADILTGVATKLLTVPAGQRTATLQRAAPLFERAGIDPGMFTSLTEEQLSDGALQAFTGEVQKQYQQLFQNESGIYGARPDGAVDTLKEFAPKPTIVPQGSVALGRDGQPMFRNPKTFAPPRPSAGRGGGMPDGPGAGGINPGEVEWDN
jgi:hypothetical protein